jgi:hypothetical protein
MTDTFLLIIGWATGFSVLQFLAHAIPAFVILWHYDIEFEPEWFWFI